VATYAVAYGDRHPDRPLFERRRTGACMQMPRPPRVAFVRPDLSAAITFEGCNVPGCTDVTFNGIGTNPMGQSVARFTAETEINRKDFGLKPHRGRDRPGAMTRCWCSARRCSHASSLSIPTSDYAEKSRCCRTMISLHHAGICVTDLERSIAFYESAFEMRLVARLTLGMEQLAFLESGTTRVELILDGSGRRPTGVVDHLALAVIDLDAWLTRLREHNVPLMDEVPIDVPALSARILFCLGPDGERIELFETRS
jgi:catechol 2,3-dioxygenase-like lactoylglutathione lyase family enzyme